jgi:hypothetical protein
MNQHEVYEFCIPSTSGCHWIVEVLSTADYDNRSKSLYITQDGIPKKFPQLESFKMQGVDIEKYTDSRAGQEITSWNIQLRTESRLMKKCGNNVQNDQRCGSYEIYLSPVVYEQQARLHYILVCSLLSFGILIAVVSFKTYLNGLLSFYGGILSFSEGVSSKKFID